MRSKKHGPPPAHTNLSCRAAGELLTWDRCKGCPWQASTDGTATPKINKRAARRRRPGASTAQILGRLHRIIDRLTSYRIASIQVRRVAHLLPYQHKCLEAGRPAEGHKRLRQYNQESRAPTPLSTMAFARSASGPAGLSINTGAANLLWVPSLSLSLSLHSQSIFLLCLPRLAASPFLVYTVLVVRQLYT